MPILGITEVKDCLGYSGITQYDSAFTNLCTWVQSEFERAIGRGIEQANYTEEIEIRREVDRILLQEYPVISVAAITVSNALVESNQYALQKDIGVIRLRTSVLNDYRNPTKQAVFIAGTTVLITYAAGYTSGSIPGEIKSALVEWIGAKFNAFGTAGFESEKLADRSYKRSPDPIPASVQAVIDRMKEVMR